MSQNIHGSLVMSAATDSHFTLHSTNILREQMKVINQVLRKKEKKIFLTFCKEKRILGLFWVFFGLNSISLFQRKILLVYIAHIVRLHTL